MILSFNGIFSSDNVIITTKNDSFLCIAFGAGLGNIILVK